MRWRRADSFEGFSIQWLARAVRVSGGPAREAVRRLAALGVLRLVERTKAGHLVEVRLPGEIRAARPGRSISVKVSPLSQPHGRPPQLRRAGQPSSRSASRGFRLPAKLARFASPSTPASAASALLPASAYPVAEVSRSCCARGSSSAATPIATSSPAASSATRKKSERPARDFLRHLYREQRLTTVELADRLRALNALAAGKLRPPIPSVVGARFSASQTAQPTPSPAKAAYPKPPSFSRDFTVVARHVYPELRSGRARLLSKELRRYGVRRNYPGCPPCQRALPFATWWRNRNVLG